MDIAEVGGYNATLGIGTGAGRKMLYYNSSGWTGSNQYVWKNFGVAQGAGYLLFGAGIFCDLAMYSDGLQDGAKTSLNIGVNTWSLIVGGVEGIFYSAGYLYWDKVAVPDIKKNPDFWVPAWDAQTKALP